MYIITIILPTTILLTKGVTTMTNNNLIKRKGEKSETNARNILQNRKL